MAEIDLAALLEKEPWDMAAVEAQVKHLASLQGELQLAWLKMAAAGRALLTAEQRQKLETILQGSPPPAGPGRPAPSSPPTPGESRPPHPEPGAPPAPRP